MKETINDRNDVLVDLMNQLYDQACRVVAISKEKQTNIECVIYVNSNGNDAIAYVYDYKTVQMTSTTTFDRLARDHLGDPALGQIISYYNQIQFEHKVPAGTNIKIPILSVNEKNQNNRIYAQPQMQKNYGRDISIGEDGDFEISMSEDFAVVSGPDNLLQAINNRLTTAVEKRIRIGVYGIRATIGDPVAIDSYLLGSIERTIKEDPRIERIEDVSFEGRGDALFITVTYTDINGNQDEYQGEI
jgi:hypothetical protein